MNKFWLITLGIIAGIVALSNIGSIFGLAVSLLIIYAGVHYYLRSLSTLAKVWWASVAVVGGISAISNVPALIGVAALVALWIIYRKWNGQNVSVVAVKESDPFTNFEQQWNKLSK
ncbi:ABC transporter permease [Planococcus antarcticus DSM 14505]|uniref:ABC transporter permease n=1 Tax=Planococcus antarcticus DSM 14505 TaxID=1185653 RepID=A0ABM6D4H4_9BACL|nr:ABC transporter permease [Planococcus antarcticus]ANU09943.1 ABC transporter permease [Planococcus antarcticus DSM 14505]